MSAYDLLDAHNKMHELQTLAKETIRIFLENYEMRSPFTGEIISTYDQVQKEMEAIENEIKKEIKEGWSNIEETEYFMIRKTTTYEYDAEELRNLIPDQCEFFIQTKASVKKAELDKAIKNEMVPEAAKGALREKSISIAFIDKKKIAEKEIKEISV